MLINYEERGYEMHMKILPEIPPPDNRELGLECRVKARVPITLRRFIDYQGVYFNQKHNVDFELKYKGMTLTNLDMVIDDSEFKNPHF
jgi:hypothetical protein